MCHNIFVDRDYPRKFFVRQMTMTSGMSRIRQSQSIKELPAFEAAMCVKRLGMQLLMKYLHAVVIKMDGIITALSRVFAQFF